MDSDGYEEHISNKEKEFEDLCRRCGQCCGSLDDPCQNLVEEEGKYFCRDYTGRLGPQKTLLGKSFNCVPIREHIINKTLRQDCGYKN